MQGGLVRPAFAVLSAGILESTVNTETEKDRFMSENTKKERIAANLASLSSLVLILFGLLQDKYEFFHELPNLIVLLICVVCTITSIWAASNLISNNKHVKVSLFQVSATSALAAVILVLNFRNLS